MERTKPRDASQVASRYYLPATPKTDGTQGPIERILKTIFRRRGN